MRVPSRNLLASNVDISSMVFGLINFTGQEGTGILHSTRPVVSRGLIIPTTVSCGIGHSQAKRKKGYVAERQFITSAYN